MLPSLQEIIHNALMLLHWAVWGGGVVVCLMFRRLSSGMWLIAAGFGGQVATGVLQQMAISAMRHGRYGSVMDPSTMSIVFSVTGLLNLILSVLIVVGMAVVFRDVDNQFRMLSHMAHRDAIQ